MDWYTILREFADSWFLLVMTLFFVGVCLYTLRPGSKPIHDDIAGIPFRNETLPAATKTCDGTCKGCQERSFL